MSPPRNGIRHKPRFGIDIDAAVHMAVEASPQTPERPTEAAALAEPPWRWDPRPMRPTSHDIGMWSRTAHAPSRTGALQPVISQLCRKPPAQ